jgi:hypothetical protein
LISSLVLITSHGYTETRGRSTRETRVPSTTLQSAAFAAGSMCSARVSASFMAQSVRGSSPPRRAIHQSPPPATALPFANPVSHSHRQANQAHRSRLGFAPIDSANRGTRAHIPAKLENLSRPSFATIARTALPPCSRECASVSAPLGVTLGSRQATARGRATAFSRLAPHCAHPLSFISQKLGASVRRIALPSQPANKP